MSARHPTLSAVFATLANLTVMAAAALWYHSYPGQIHAKWPGERRHVFLDSDNGMLRIQWMNHPVAHKPRVGRFDVQPSFPPDEFLAYVSRDHPRRHHATGFSVHRGDFTNFDARSEWSYRIIYVDWWLITALAAALWLTWLIRAIRRRRRLRLQRAGRCPHCGYDCRATLDRCPECGAVVAANTKSETRNQNQ